MVRAAGTQVSLAVLGKVRDALRRDLAGWRPPAPLAASAPAHELDRRTFAMLAHRARGDHQDGAA